MTEASEQMIQSANLIQVLKSENRQLKTVIEEIPDSMSEQKNVSDDGKEKQMIVKLRNKVQDLNNALHRSEQMLTRREEEVRGALFVRYFFYVTNIMLYYLALFNVPLLSTGLPSMRGESGHS